LLDGKIKQARILNLMNSFQRILQTGSIDGLLHQITNF